MSADQQRVRDLITDTVLLLCKNGLSYSEQLRIEGVIGITLDNKDLFLVHVNERLGSDVGTGSFGVTSSGHCDAAVTQLPVEEPSRPTSVGNATDGVAARFDAPDSDGSDAYAPDFAAVGEKLEDSRGVIKIEDDDEPEDAVYGDGVGTNHYDHHHHHHYRYQQHYHHRRHHDHHNSSLPLRMPKKRPHRHYNSTLYQQDGALQAPHSAHTADEYSLYETDSKRFAADDGFTVESEDDSGATTRLAFPDGALEEAWPQLEPQNLLETDDQLETGCSTTWAGDGGGGGAFRASTALEGLFSTSVPATEAKYPSHALQSHNIKEALSHGVAGPLLDLNPAARVVAFRLSWFGSEAAHLDRVWRHIVGLQERMDRFVCAVPGAQVVVSAYTATLSGRATKTDTPGVRLSYPGLAYWVLTGRCTLDERLLLRQLNEHALGARIKSLLYEHECSRDKVTNALFVVLKDCTGGFVRRKVDESLAACDAGGPGGRGGGIGGDGPGPGGGGLSGGRPGPGGGGAGGGGELGGGPGGGGREKPALVRLWVRDQFYWPTMLAAQARLKNACCDVSVHNLFVGT